MWEQQQQQQKAEVPPRRLGGAAAAALEASDGDTEPSMLLQKLKSNIS